TWAGSPLVVGLVAGDRGDRPAYPGRMLAFYGWLRRHPVLVDSVLALAVGSLGLSVLGDGGGHRVPRLVALLFVAAMVAPIAVRRKHPVGVFIAVIIVGAIEVVTLPSPVGSDVAVLVVLYTLAAYRPRRVAVPGLLTCLIGSAVAIASWAPPQ